MFHSHFLTPSDLLRDSPDLGEEFFNSEGPGVEEEAGRTPSFGTPPQAPPRTEEPPTKAHEAIGSQIDVRQPERICRKGLRKEAESDKSWLRTSMAKKPRMACDQREKSGIWVDWLRDHLMADNSSSAIFCISQTRTQDFEVPRPFINLQGSDR
jgi:hypothetical protein